MTDLSSPDEATAATASPQTGRARYLALAREILWVGAGQGGAVVAALIGLAQLTRFLEPGEFGRFALALSTGTLVTLIVFGPVGAGGARYFAAARERGELTALVAAITRILVRRYSLVAILGLASGAGLALATSWEMGVFALVTVLYSCTSSLSTILEALLNAGRQRHLVAVHKLLQQALSYGLAIAGLMWVHVSASLVLLAFACGAGMTAASMYFALHRRLVTADPAAAPRTDTEPATGETEDWGERLRSYARPLGRWGALQWLQSTSDRWILAALRGTAEAGLYAVVYQLGFTPLGLFSTLVSQTLDPVIYARAGDATAAGRLHQADRLRHIGLLCYGGVAALFVIGALLLHGPVFALLVDPQYAGVSPLLGGMALAGGLAGLGSIQALKWLARLRPDRLEFSRHVTSILGLIFVVIGASVAGAPGVVAAQVAYGCVYLVWTIALR